MPTRQQEKMEICGGKSYMPPADILIHNWEFGKPYITAKSFYFEQNECDTDPSFTSYFHSTIIIIITLTALSLFSFLHLLFYYEHNIKHA